MTEDFSIVEPADVPTTRFDTCETAVRKLTEPLGCVELRVNQVIVEPGEVTTPHTHEGQEEVFVALTDGQISIADEIHDVPEGGIVRVDPETVRNLLNRTEETHVWLAFGAPPVGTVDDFGAYVVPDDR
ncbi:cupin domain-containing protein [haloarchaeon 3A1-DGR]|nr:cupin domain-containing protein [haloarchaeon 3A1-DGR]